MLPSSWIGGAAQAHALLGWVSQEVRAGKQDLALLLEKDRGVGTPPCLPRRLLRAAEPHPGGRPFGNPNLQPLWMAEKNLAEQANCLAQHGLSPLPDGDPAGFSAGWADPGGWNGTRGYPGCPERCTPGWLEARASGKSALHTGGENTPALVTILEAL